MVSESLAVRLQSALYCRVQIRRGDLVVFDERVPYDAAALRASVTVCARTIAAWSSAERQADQQAGGGEAAFGADGL